MKGWNKFLTTILISILVAGIALALGSVIGIMLIIIRVVI